MVTTIIQDPITGAITLGEQVPRSVLERAAAGRHGGSPPRLEPQQSIPMHHPEPVRIVQAESGNSAVLQLQQECTRRGQLAVLPLQRDRTPQDIVVRKAPLATSSTESPIPDPYVTPRQAQRVSSGQRSGERSGEEPLFWVPVFASDMAGENTEGTSIITRRKSPATPPSRITRVETLESWASGSEDKSAQPEQRAHFRSWSYHEGGNGLKASLETAGKRRSNPPELSRKTSLPNAPEPLAQHVRRFQHLNIPIYDEADVDAALREQQRKRRAGSQQCSPPKGAPLEPSPKYPLPSPAFFIPASSPAPNLAASDIRREYGGYVGHNGELGRSSGLAGGAASSGLFDYREVTRFQSGDICYVESPASINEPMLGSQQAYGKPNDPEATPTPTLRKGGMDSFPGLSPDQTPTASISQSSSQRSIVSSATTLVRHSPIEPSAHLDLDSMSRSFSPLLFSPARTPLSPDPAAQINALRSRKASPYDDLWLRTLTPSMDTSSLPQQEVASSLEPAQRSDQHGPKSSTFSDNQFLASFESSDEGRTAGSKKRRR